MLEDFFAKTVVTLALLLFTASVAAIVLKKIKFPYTIGLVLLGIGVGYLGDNVDGFQVLQNIHLTPDLIMYILLPTLIFEASVNIDSRLLVKNITPVLILAAPGLLISTVLVGCLVAWFTPLNIGGAMVFGALISATDPVAVITMFKEIGAPRRLTMLVDGESLFNDATAIVAFRIVFGMVSSGAGFGFMELVKGGGEFFTVFFGGLFVGGAIGYIAIRFTGLAKRDPVIQVAFSTVAAYLSFIIADHHLGTSGVMSAMGAGIVMSWYGVTRFTNEVKEYLERFWEYAAFVANSFIFLLLGVSEFKLLTDFGRIAGLAGNVLLTILAVSVARALVVFGICPLLNKLPGSDKIDLRCQSVIFWGGLRGAVPLALAFSLASDFENRQLIVEMTLGVVLFTILVQGTTIHWLLSWFGLDKTSVIERFLGLKTQLHGKCVVTRTAEMIGKREGVRASVLSEFHGMKTKEIDELEQKVTELKKDADFCQNVVRRLLWLEAVAIGSHAYSELFEQGILSESVFREYDLMAKQTGEVIIRGGMPAEGVEVKPLERRFEEVWLVILRNFCPVKSLVRRFESKMVGVAFESALAQVIAAKEVQERLPKVAEELEASDDVLKECESFYEKRAKLASKVLAQLEERHFDDMSALQSMALQRLSLSLERDALSKFVDSGIVPATVSAKLREDLELEADQLDRKRFAV